MIISFINTPETGQTASVFALASLLACRGSGLNVLVFDLGNKARLTQMVDKRLPPDYVTFLDAANSDAAIKTYPLEQGVDILPARDYDIQIINGLLRSDDEFRLKIGKVIQHVKETASRYSFTFIDCSGIYGAIARSMLLISDFVYLTACLDEPSFETTQRNVSVIIRVLNSGINKRLKFGGIFFTKFSFENRCWTDFLEKFSQAFPNKCLGTYIGLTCIIPRAMSVGKSVASFAKYSIATSQYSELLDEMLRITLKASKYENGR